MKKTIVIVEDNELILNGLVYSLSEEGFNCIKARNKKEALENINKNVDLYILDITLPDGDGFEVCKNVKKMKDIPVIFLTAKDEENDVVQGIDLGADDYIIKPFRLRELISRIKMILRRYDKEIEKSNLIKVKDVTINLDKKTVYKGDKEVEFTALEYKILLMLFSNSKQIITREQLLDKIWDIAGNFVNDNTLTVYIKRIREKIEDDMANPTIIKTVRGIGYRIGE